MADVWEDYLAASTSPTTVARFDSKIARGDRCWTWSGGKTPAGYGRFKFRRRDMYAHRLAYLVFKGAFDPALEIDHLCRNRACVNPNHLEPVTHEVNVMRGSAPMVLHAHKKACIHGHPFDESNTAYEHKGSAIFRRCRACGAPLELDPNAPVSRAPSNFGLHTSDIIHRGPRASISR